MVRSLVFVAVLWAAVALPTEAHAPLANRCIAPTRPIDDQDDVRWRAFLIQIDRFRACVTTESEQQLAAAREHQAAARAAVDAWNTFVRDSLSAPEDFPWPPEEP